MEKLKEQRLSKVTILKQYKAKSFDNNAKMYNYQILTFSSKISSYSSYP